MPVAYNAQTGEALRLDEGGAWSPTKIAKNPQTGEMLALDGAQWVGVTKPEMGWGEYADNIVRQVANGATFGFADEIAAKLGDWTGIGGKSGQYDANLEAQRSKDKAFEAEYPIAAGASQVAGGIGSAIAAAPAAGFAAAPARLLPNVARNAAIGAGAGGLTGFGTGEGGFENRAENALLGAGLGGAVGGALPLAVSGVGKVAAPFMRSGAEKADLKLAQAIKRDGLSPQQVAANLGDLGPNAALSDAGGENLSSLGRAVAGVPGKAKNTAADFFTARQEGQGARLAEAVQGATGAKGDYYGTIEQLMAQRSKEAAPLYEAAYAKPFVWSDDIAQLMERPSMKQALGKAYRIASEEGVDPKGLGLAMNEAGDVVFETVPGMRTLDYLKRGLDDVVEKYRDSTTGRLALNTEGNAINGTRAQLLRLMDDLNPDYKAARAAWAGPTQAKEAMAMGRSFIKNDEEITKGILAKMSDSEKEFFREGVTRALRDVVYKADDGANAVRRIFGNKMIRDKLSAAFPSEEAFQQFSKTMQTEAAFYGSRAKVLQGSRTTPMAQEISDLTSMGGMLGEVGPAAAKAARGNMLGAAGDIARAGWERIARPAEAIADPLSQMLFTSDPAANARTLQRLIAPPPPRPPSPEVQQLRGLLYGGASYGGGLLSGR